MKTSFIMLAILVTGINCSAQQVSQLKQNKFNDVGFLYIISLNHHNNIISQNVVISPDKTQSLEMISRVECIKRFGIFTSFGAGIFKLKPHTKLMLLNQILKKFKIVSTNISKVLIDDLYVESPETIVIEENLLVDVKISSNPEDNKSVINIITSDHLERKSERSQTREYLLLPQEVDEISKYIEIK